MRTIRITLKEGRESTILDSKGEKQSASLTLLWDGILIPLAAAQSPQIKISMIR